MGNYFSETARPAQAFVVDLDGDQASRSASRQIVDTLNHYTGTPVHRIDLPQRLDPNDLDNLELSPAFASPVLILIPNLPDHPIGLVCHYAKS